MAQFKSLHRSRTFVLCHCRQLCPAQSLLTHLSVLLWWKWYDQDNTVNCNVFNLQKSTDYIFFLVKIEMHIIRYQLKISHFVFCLC